MLLNPLVFLCVERTLTSWTLLLFDLLVKHDYKGDVLEIIQTMHVLFRNILRWPGSKKLLMGARNK